MAEWSELPSELLELISNLSITTSDTRRFRSVCSSWRSSVPTKPPSHFFSPTITSFSSQAPLFSLRLVRQTIFLLTLASDPASSWVFKFEEHKPGLVRLLSPFSKNAFIKHLECKSLDITNVNTFELGHEYVLRNIGGNVGLTSLYNMECEKVAYACVGEANLENFTLLSTHNSTGKLLMYRSNVQEWAFLDDLALGYDDGGDFVYDWSMRYVDVAEYEGRFYAVTDSGRTVIIECVDDLSVVVSVMVKSIIGGDKKRLVKSGDDLLLVDLYTCPAEGSVEVNAIDIFKLDKNDKRWMVLKSLEGRSIFLGNFSSFSASNLHGIKENCIYFCLKKLSKRGGNGDDCCYDEDGVESREIGVFEYENGKFGSFFEDSTSISWPPPPWINLLT